VFVKLIKFRNFCKGSRKSFFFQIFLINTIVSIFALSIVIAITLLSSLRHTKEILVSNCENMATSLAENYVVYDSLVSKRATNRLLTYLDSILANSSTIDSITIIDINRICLYHYDRAVTGTEIPILPDGKNEVQFATMAIGTDEHKKPITQMCAFVPILNGSGSVFGYAIVGIFTSTLKKLNRSYISHFLLIVTVAMITAFSTSYYIVTRIRNSLMGYEPESFADLLIRRNEVLDNLEEGLLAVDISGKVTVCTQTACKLYNLPPHNYEGRDIRELGICNELLDILQTKTPVYNLQQSSGKNNLLTDLVPMKEKSKMTGAVAIIRDHTAYTNMAEELTGFRFVVEALRSNMHNFKNELHVILGMLQLGETKLAIDYITRFNSIQTSQSCILKNIQNKTIAALILGKTNEAKEQGVDLFVDESSILQRHNPYLNVSQLTVLLGNILENSIEATKTRNDGGEIRLYIKSGNDCIKINVDDNGCGIPNEIQDRLFTRGFTTKSENSQNHGIGLYTVNEIVKEREGIIQIDSSPGEGTSVSIQIVKRRAGYEHVIVKDEAS
jgi:two-component system sensor histidine kinase DctS